MLTLKEVLDYVEQQVKNHSCLLKVWQVEFNNRGQINVQHPLSEKGYNIFEAYTVNGKVRLDYIDSNFKSYVEKWLWDKLGQALPY